jgi:hypothetical protein
MKCKEGIMRIGDVVENDHVEWTVTRTDGRGNPLALRTIGRQKSIHLGSVIDQLDAVVKSKMFVLEEGFTQIELLPPPKPVYALVS